MSVAEVKGRAPGGAVATGAAGQFAWALFEWARNPYVILVTIYIFSPYFATHVAETPAQGQALVSLAHSISGFILAIMSPIFGAIADVAGRRKWWIFACATSLALGSSALWFVEPKATAFTLTLVVVLKIINDLSYDFTHVFHNALLINICPRPKLGALSGLGLALGNAGSLVLLIFALWAFALPGVVDWSFVPKQPLFGLDRALHEQDRIVGPLVALWLILFTLPMMVLTPDAAPRAKHFGQAVVDGLRSLRATLRQLRDYRNIAHYLLARMIFADGKAGILIFGGVYAAGAFGWSSMQLVIYGITLSFAAFFGGVLGGWIDDRFGSKKALQIALVGVLIAGIMGISQTKDRLFGFIPVDMVNGHGLWQAPFFRTAPELAYLVVGTALAMALTSAYATSRSLMARLVPPEKAAQFFGLYTLSGTATSFLAPSLVGIVTAWSGDLRTGFSMTLVLVAVGFALLWGVKPPADEAR